MVETASDTSTRHLPTASEQINELRRVPDNTETSHILLNSLHTGRTASTERNNADTKKDTDAVKGDHDSVTLAQKTNQDVDALKQYLAHGGHFNDAQGRALGRRVVADLRKEHGDHAADRTADLEYAGGKKGAYPSLIVSTASDSDHISADVKALNNPNLSPADRAKILTEMDKSADSLIASAGKEGADAGKDLKDMAQESQLLKQDIAALASGKLTPEQEKVINAELASRDKLIGNQAKDLGNETWYAKDDTRAIQAGGDLEAVINSGMHSHSAKTMQQLGKLLDSYHNKDGKGTLDQVVHDRNEDIRLEPVYVRDNNENNKINQRVLELPDPFVTGDTSKGSTGKAVTADTVQT